MFTHFVCFVFYSNQMFSTSGIRRGTDVNKYEESYFTLFYDIKSRTFDIYSCQFAFIIFISSQIAFFDRIMRNAPFMSKSFFLRTLVNFMRNLLTDLSDCIYTSGEIFFMFLTKTFFFLTDI